MILSRLIAAGDNLEFGIWLLTKGMRPTPVLAPSAFTAPAVRIVSLSLAALEIFAQIAVLPATPVQVVCTRAVGTVSLKEFPTFWRVP